MSTTERVPGYKLQAGDQILGTDMIVASVKFAGMGDIGSDKERQRYTITMSDGRAMTVNAEYVASVLR